MPELMQWERDLIVNSMTRKSSKDIAALLCINEKIVAAFIVEHSTGIVTKDAKICERMQKVTRLNPAKKPKAKKITSAKITYAPIKRKEKRYADRLMKLSELIPVQIDRKTWIYIKAGADVELAKKQFLKNSNYKIV